MDMAKQKYTWFFAAFFLVFTPLFSQTPDSLQSSPQQNSQIQLKTFVESSNTPLNRPVVFHIELSWIGELNRYQIEPVSQPVLTNLLLEGSGSENRLEPLDNGQFRSIKSITYRFRPLEMGMAYIEGVVVKYVNRQTGEEDQLSSQRVMVEVTDPLPEPGGGKVKPVIYIALLVIFFAAIFYFLLLFFKRRKEARLQPAPVIPLSEQYLDRLSHEVDPRGTNLNEMTGKLSRIFREYLDQEFSLHARESSTQEIVNQLRDLDMDEKDKNNLIRVLEKLDLLKFAGKNVDPADFTNIYGTIEAFLLKQKRNPDSSQVELKEEQ